MKNVLVSRNEPRELENINASDLDQFSTSSSKERQKDEEQYEPTSLRSFVSSFDRYLRKEDYPSTVMEGKEFRKTKDVLVAKQKELKILKGKLKETNQTLRVC